MYSMAALSSLTLSAISEEDFTYLSDKVSDKASVYSEDGEHWHEEALNCSICDKRFSAVFRRHHCRVCFRSVCAKCAPNNVMLAGYDKVQRACTPCTSYIQKEPIAKKRLAALGERIWAMSGTEPPEEDAQTAEDALIRCELALTSLEERHQELNRCTELAEAQLIFEQEAHQEAAVNVFNSRNLFCQLAEELHAMNGGLSLVATDFTEMSLEESMTFCEQAVDVLKRRCQAKSFPSAPRPESHFTLTAISRASCPDVFVASKGMRDLAKTDLEASSGNVWAPDAKNCSICEKLLGKRYFNPRHHCRSCGRCVCSACSPNAVLMEGAKQRQRICKQCVGDGVQKRSPVSRTSATLPLHSCDPLG